jgi:hypothetical protein
MFKTKTTSAETETKIGTVETMTKTIKSGLERSRVSNIGYHIHARILVTLLMYKQFQ